MSNKGTPVMIKRKPGPRRKPRSLVSTTEKPRSTRLRFDASSHPSAEARTDAFRAAMSVSMDVHYEPDDVESFDGRVDLFSLGSATLAVLESTPHTALRTKVMADRWAYDVVALDLFTAGSLTGRIGGHTVAVGPGDLFIVDLRGSMRIRLAAHRCLSLVMPRALFDAAAGGYLAVDGMVFPAATLEAGLLAPLLTDLASAAPDLDPDRAAALGAGAVAFAAACARARLPFSRGPRNKPANPTLLQLRRHIDRHAADPSFGPEALAARFRVSRATLYRLFTPVGGVASVIRHARADVALRVLRHDEATSLVAAARVSGFADVRTMRDALRTVHGLTPDEARASASSITDTEAQLGAQVAAFLDGAGP